jgi:hypothetical protein
LQFRERVVSAVNKLPADFKNQIGRRQTVSNTKTTPKKCIELSDSLKKNLSRWNAKPCAIFTDTDDLQPGFDHDAVKQAYACLLELEHRSDIDKLRQRLYKVMFYRLKLALEIRCYQKQKRRRLAYLIDKSKSDMIENNLKRWTPVGKKLDILCQGLSERLETSEEGRCGRKKLDENERLVFIFILPEKYTEH